MKKGKKKLGFWLTIITITIIVIGTFIWVVTLSLDKPPKKDKVQEEIISEPEVMEASLVMVGDALIHSTLYEDAKTSTGYDFKPMLEIMKPIISSYDLAYYNQETILGGSELGYSSYPRFNSPYEVGDAFLDAGFNIVSLATNHTLDKGESGVLKSYNYWKNKDVLFAGSYDSFTSQDEIRIKEVNGIKYTLLSYTTSTNGLRIPDGKTYLVNVYDENRVKADIEKVRDQVDIVMVAMHWGTEYYHGVDSNQRQIANFLANLGVDIVIGTHPHVVEPIEFIDKTMVIYSLGNFISDQVGIERLTGLMASVKIRKTIDKGITTIELIDPKAELIHTKSVLKRKRDFKVYPYTNLNEELLPNYRSLYQKYIEIVTNNNPKILTTPIE